MNEQSKKKSENSFSENSYRTARPYSAFTSLIALSSGTATFESEQIFRTFEKAKEEQGELPEKTFLTELKESKLEDVLRPSTAISNIKDLTTRQLTQKKQDEISSRLSKGLPSSGVKILARPSTSSLLRPVIRERPKSSIQHRDFDRKLQTRPRVDYVESYVDKLDPYGTMTTKEVSDTLTKMCKECLIESKTALYMYKARNIKFNAVGTQK